MMKGSEETLLLTAQELLDDKKEREEEKKKKENEKTRKERDRRKTHAHVEGPGRVPLDQQRWIFYSKQQNNYPC